MIKVSPHNVSWNFTAIYASNVYHNRRILWNNLITYSRTISNLWLVAGDFNELLSQTDKWGVVLLTPLEVLIFGTVYNHVTSWI